MSISFPSVAQLRESGKMEALSIGYDFSRACFAVNVTAEDIPSRSVGTCDIPTGVFIGFVKPGETLTLSVPRGSARKLEIIAFRRTSSADPCPENRSGLTGLDAPRLARVGLLSSFDALQSEVTVEVALKSPTGTLASQYSLPQSCMPKPALSLPSSAFTAGRTVQTGGNYQAVATVGGVKSEITIQGGSYRARFSRKAQ